MIALTAENNKHIKPGEKTPWYPSKSALKRVKNSLAIPTEHCGHPVKVSHHLEVYGSVYGDWPWMYCCSKCDARVGMHPFTHLPLGTLADEKLRKARTVCKAPFEVLWKRGRISRSQAYSELAKHLGIKVSACHFGWFDEETCNKAKTWALARLKETD